MSNYIAQNNDTIHKKSERIASAIFLVSSNIPESEILRTSIKNNALELVSLCVSIKDGFSGNRFQLVKFAERKIAELLSLLRVASVAGLISEMNANVLIKELESLLQIMSETYKSYYINQSTFSDEFFNDLSKNIETGMKDSLPDRVGNFVSANVLKRDEKDRPGRKTQRSKDIIDLITKKGVVSIKDISTSIKGCSEKTVQRELMSLIKEGLVEKMGERRWSRYSLRIG